MKGRQCGVYTECIASAGGTGITDKKAGAGFGTDRRAGAGLVTGRKVGGGLAQCTCRTLALGAELRGGRNTWTYWPVSGSSSIFLCGCGGVSI